MDKAHRIRTGIDGLDDILGGGLPPNRVYLIEGNPGVGKTTLALQFLLEGVRNGERCLYVTLSETAEELRAVAASHGWTLEGVEIHELSTGEHLSEDSDNTLFHPSEIELGETTRAILSRVSEKQPQRVAFDSLSELRLLAQQPLRYRRQILALKQFFVGRNCTVLLMDDRTSESGDPQLQSIVHGVIQLDAHPPTYGAERRRLLVRKLRGVSFRSGWHDYRIRRGGLDVTPRLVASEHRARFDHELVSSGVAELDSLFCGGLDRGTSTLLIGPAGCGKSAVSTRYAYAAAERGERSAIFCFDEAPRTLLARSAGLGMPLEPHVEKGLVHIRQVDPAELSPGEFAALVREQVTAGTRIVVIDSLNGYMHSMPEAQYLSAQLHELLSYLGQLGVLTIMVLAQHGMVGLHMNAPVDVSYLADSVLLFRYYEHAGQVRKALSVVKRRRGNHERSIRELRFDGKAGVLVGDPLSQFRGVLTGVPTLDPRAT
ncbi:MAG: ATPase domain-containing protein [Polyangiales bacterium]